MVEPIESFYKDQENEVFDSSQSSNIPIFSLDGSGDGMSFGKSRAEIDWSSWDMFISLLMDSSILVKKDERSRLMSYSNGFLVLKSFTKTKVICVKGIKSCMRKNRLMVIDTEEYGVIRIMFSKMEHAIPITKVLMGFVAGTVSYTHLTLPTKA